jgi:hypothetical protein
MAKRLIKEIAPYIELYRDPNTGIAWVENGSAGIWHSAHPNIDVSGSVKGMKKLGYWNENDIVVRSNGSYHNVSKIVVSDEYDKIAYEHCRCEGCSE